MISDHGQKEWQRRSFRFRHESRPRKSTGVNGQVEPGGNAESRETIMSGPSNTSILFIRESAVKR